MNSKTRFGRRTMAVAGAGLLAMAMAACGMMTMMMGTGAVPPAAEEFGLGPRASGTGAYVGTLQPAAPLAVRKLQSVSVRITDAHGSAVEGATVSVDGGMPQHGHGLPTSPRVTAYRGDGVYQIDGVRFNMGGWWEFKLGVAAAAGTDTITFNLKL
jgi:hypothetical protein